MISYIQLLRNIGQFDSVDAGAAIELNRYVLVYAENGRGKTTLAAILRSLATGDPVPIRERRRLAAVHPPHVVLECSVGPSPAVFENGAWNRTFPDMVIFDDQFVDENVYSGLSVAPAHRQHLHELVIGAQGVALNHRLQELVARIEEHNTELRTRAAAISAIITGPFPVDDFCGLPASDDIDMQIRLAEQALAAAREQDSVRDTPGFDVLELPNFDAQAITRILQLDLAALDAAAAERVQQHFRELGGGGEAWVADGMRRIVHMEGGQDLCPFCAQDLAQSGVIPHYRAYFGQEYAGLKQSISQALIEIRNRHPRELPERLERALRNAAGRRQFWSRFCDVPVVALDTEQLMREWQASRDGVVAALEAKQAAPLDRMEIPRIVRDEIESYAVHRRDLETLNGQLQRANEVIRAVKGNAAAGNPEAATANLARLTAIRTRHTPGVSALCQQYSAARVAKAATEALRDHAQGELELYRATAFPRYQHAINHYLSRFGADYRIHRVAAADTRGGPTCNYDVVINNAVIPISGGIPGPGEPAFRNTLSSGDRNSLALAFFFSSIDPVPDRPNPEIANKVVVIDDPVSSLDEHREVTTVQELRRLGTRVSQLIVLSHDRTFLCQLWQKINQAPCTSIRVERDATGSTIAVWDVSRDSLTEHDRNHALLRSYLRDGPGQNSRSVAVALRPTLEAFLRVARPEHFPPEARILHRFMRACRERRGTAAEILNARDTQELTELLEYADLFHHDTNPAFDIAEINDGQLQGFVRRVLEFAKR